MDNKIKKIIIGFFIIGSIVALDQYIKNRIVKNMAVGEQIPVINDILSITYRQNTGLAFSLFESSPSVIFILLSCIIIVGLFFFLRPYFKYGWTVIFGSFVIGGAVGNLIDRIWRFDNILGKNFVVDYIEFNFFPTFNLADIFISCGVFLLVFYIIYIERKLFLDENNKEREC